MRRTVLLALAALSSLPFAASANAAEITITCGSVGAEQALCQSAVAQWEAMTGHEVEVYASPMSPAEQLELYGQLLESESADVDVFQIDLPGPVSWASISSTCATMSTRARSPAISTASSPD